jgi:hypothetical protein
MSLKVAPNGPAAVVPACLLSGDERTKLRRGPRSEIDPNETSDRLSFRRCGCYFSHPVGSGVDDDLVGGSLSRDAGWWHRRFVARVKIVH